MATKAEEEALRLSVGALAPPDPEMAGDTTPT